MIVRFSTGLRNALATRYGLAEMMAGGWIGLYGTDLPDVPDAPTGGPLLARITQDGNLFLPPDDPQKGGLQFYFSPTNPGAITRYGVWKLTGLANGTAKWFRWWWSRPDDGSQSLTYPRVDGDVGDLQSLAALRLASVQMSAGKVIPMQFASIRLPIGSG